MSPNGMPSILEQLGLDPNSLQWYDLALCKGMETENFYDKYIKDKNVAAAVDDICLHCPVMKQCAQDAIDNKLEGVRGAVYWDETGKPDSHANKHKSPQVWNTIKGRINE